MKIEKSKLTILVHFRLKNSYTIMKCNTKCKLIQFTYPLPQRNGTEMTVVLEEETRAVISIPKSHFVFQNEMKIRSLAPRPGKASSSSVDSLQVNQSSTPPT